jgi:hypothetical protein
MFIRLIGKRVSEFFRWPGAAYLDVRFIVAPLGGPEGLVSPRTFLRKGGETAGPSTTLLRSSGRDDKWVGWRFQKTGAFFITLGGPKGHDFSGRDDKGEGGASGNGSCWTEAVFHHLGWARRPMTPSVGMTRGRGLLRECGGLDRIERLSAATADPSSALLRSSGLDDKGRAATFREGSDLDGENQVRLEDLRASFVRRTAESRG